MKHAFVLLERQSLSDRLARQIRGSIQVEALRSNWLIARCPDSFTSPSIVLVYMDNVKLGAR